ncbi:hypothetical protein DD238_007522 [Peronospora effusa]|uniref:Uncharacterized protein n=1 Tax=Peronospora effusa TaxID=542832 RepID=A0A3M6V7R6_9STRA|nr:hypothetical protein DD238_007522 [Peronospora effusa]RQM12072.1 hypothetical protein DD237_004918 [Peronospora effusa]
MLRFARVGPAEVVSNTAELFWLCWECFGVGSVVWAKAYLPIIALTSVPDLPILRNSHSLGGLNIHGEIVHKTQECGENVSIRSSRGYESVANLAVREEKDPSANDSKAQVKKMTLIQSMTSLTSFLCLYRLIVLSKISATFTTLFDKTAALNIYIVYKTSTSYINGLFSFVGQLVIKRVFNVEHAFVHRYHCYHTLIRNESYTVLTVLVFQLTLSYGGGLGTIPCFLTDMFDVFSDLVSVVAWWRGGRTDLNDKYTAASKNGATPEDAYIDSIYKILIVVCVTGSFVFMVRTNPRDRFEKGYHHNLLASV